MFNTYFKSPSFCNLISSSLIKILLVIMIVVGISLSASIPSNFLRSKELSWISFLMIISSAVSGSCLISIEPVAGISNDSFFSSSRLLRADEDDSVVVDVVVVIAAVAIDVDVVIGEFKDAANDDITLFDNFVAIRDEDVVVAIVVVTVDVDVVDNIVAEELR